MNRIYPPNKFIVEYLETHTRHELDILAEKNYKIALEIEKNMPTYNSEINALIIIN